MTMTNLGEECFATRTAPSGKLRRSSSDSIKKAARYPTPGRGRRASFEENRRVRPAGEVLIPPAKIICTRSRTATRPPDPGPHRQAASRLRPAAESVPVPAPAGRRRGNRQPRPLRSRSSSSPPRHHSLNQSPPAPGHQRAATAGCCRSWICWYGLRRESRFFPGRLSCLLKGLLSARPLR